MRSRNIFAGHTLLLEESGVEIMIEDWAENVLGEGWTERHSEPAPLFYATRVLAHDLPVDDAVLYGKINGLGALVHVIELAFPACDEPAWTNHRNATLDRGDEGNNDLTLWPNG